MSKKTASSGPWQETHNRDKLMFLLIYVIFSNKTLKNVINMCR